MMTDQEIKQRIAYLVEHGGICDDPLVDIRRDIRILYVLLGLVAVFEFIELFM
jgi:hypothetical protein